MAKNTGIVYLRMFFLVIISFYTSRVLLKTLGVIDFGVYSIVGSISSTFIAIKSLFSESIQRFLNVSKGKRLDSYKEQISIFNIGLIIHFVLIILFVIVVEIVGTWLLHTKLDIPVDRYDTAFFVFHMSVIATSISIASIPYDAVIIANEKMGFYATISVFDGLLKLIFVFLLPVIGLDYLKMYSLLLIVIPSSTLLIQFLYTKRFVECKYIFEFEKGLFRDIFSLSSWNFFGNISFSLIHEGINMLLNVFGGVIMNSARAIAYQVRSMTSQLTANTMLAVRPSIMQRSSSLEKKEFYESIITLSRISFFIMFILMSALIVYIPQIIEIWLGTVPKNSALFTRIVLIGVVIRSLHEPLNMMYMSIGKIKRVMVVESFIMIVFLGIIYLVLKGGAPIWSPFAILALMEMVIIIMISANAYYELDFPFSSYIKRVLLPISFLMAFSAILFYFLAYIYKADTIISTLIGVLFSTTIGIALCCILLEKKEHILLMSILRNTVNKINVT